METNFEAKITELRAIISKMPLHMCCLTVLPEFGLQWSQLSQAVHSAQLPMTAANVARVICKHAMSMQPVDLAEVISQCRLQLVATQNKTWHMIHLLEPHARESIADKLCVIPRRIAHALRNSKLSKNANIQPEIRKIHIDDLMYMSVQLVSSRKTGAPLYLAFPLGQDVVFVTSLYSHNLLRACVEGLGYKKYEDANLYGSDIKSLLRVHTSSDNINHLSDLPPYAPTPLFKNNGIDYTNQSYNENYVDNILGPNPPLINELKINFTKPFYDETILKKNVNVNFSFKSTDVAQSLKSLVSAGALAPTSRMFVFFHELRCNKFSVTEE